MNRILLFIRLSFPAECGYQSGSVLPPSRLITIDCVWQ